MHLQLREFTGAEHPLTISAYSSEVLAQLHRDRYVGERLRGMVAGLSAWLILNHAVLLTRHLSPINLVYTCVFHGHDPRFLTLPAI